MKRETVVRPGFDCRTECKHDPPGDHGICGEEWCYVVSDGGRALSLGFLSAHYPDSVTEPLPDVLRQGVAGPLMLHSADPNGVTCQWVTGGRCSLESISYLSSGRLWALYGDPRQTEQSEAFWLALETKLREWRGN